MVKLNPKGQGLYELDCRGYVCPYPQLYTLKSLEKMKPGEVLEVTFDNPSSEETIKMACDKTGNKILSLNKESGTFVYKIQKV